MAQEKPIVAITIGDPAGIGPEIVLKALTQPEIYEHCRPLVIGSARVLEMHQKSWSVTVSLNCVQSVAEAKFAYGQVDVLDLDNIDVDHLEMGVVQAACGQASYEYIDKACELAREKAIDAICTAPINKEALKAAHVPYIGHTEMIAAMLGVEEGMTMFAIESLRIFFLTRHVSLAEACRRVADTDFVYRGILQAYGALEELAGPNPKLAVAGLNPHAGEGGLLGQEEQTSIRPAVQHAVAEGLNVVGPVPADSVFHFASQGAYDAVLSLYHDQGHIASKMMDFEKTVSFTLGLPTLRTSVDHGTAFDIAGQNKASAISMVEAIKAAYTYA